MRNFLTLLCLFSTVLFLGAAELQLDPSRRIGTNSVPAVLEHFTPILTGEGKPEGWKIVMDDTPSFFPAVTPDAQSNSKKPVFAQTIGAEKDEYFPMFVYDEVFGDFTATLKIKMVDGKLERMAGLAFRIQDEKNYYVVRASSLGNTFKFYKYVDGVRSPGIGLNNVKITPNEWHELRVECFGNKIRCTLDEQLVIPELTDMSFNRGKIGLWTKSDSVSYFCDVNIKYTPRESIAENAVANVVVEYDRLEDIKLFGIPPGKKDYVVIASKFPEDRGKQATNGALNSIHENAIFTGETKKSWTVTMPLLDENGEPMGAVTVVLKKFPGQTKKNAIERGKKIMRLVQRRVTTKDEFFDK